MCSVFYTRLSCQPHSIPVREVLLFFTNEEIGSDTLRNLTRVPWCMRVRADVWIRLSLALNLGSNLLHGTPEKASLLLQTTACTLTPRSIASQWNGITGLTSSLAHGIIILEEFGLQIQVKYEGWGIMEGSDLWTVRKWTMDGTLHKEGRGDYRKGDRWGKISVLNFCRDS